MHDVIIVGGGPAGLTAGIYAARAGRSALLLEKSMVGGQIALTTRIDNYPGFAEGADAVDLCMAMEAQAKSAGVAIAYEAAVSIDCAGRAVQTGAGRYQAEHLILALGAKPRRLSVPGEEALIGRGVSFCATCDGALYRGRRVAVVGGGNSAVEEALYLAGLGCETLLIHRRDTLRAERALAEQALANPRIHFLLNSEVEAFVGDKKMEEVRLNGGRVERVDCAFISIGRIPDTELLAGQLALDEQGFIVAGEDCRTSIPKVFAAGDARTKRVRQVVTAVADGAAAASWLL